MISKMQIVSSNITKNYKFIVMSITPRMCHWRVHVIVINKNGEYTVKPLKLGAPKLAIKM